METLLMALIFIAGFALGGIAYALINRMLGLEREVRELRRQAEGRRQSNFMIAGSEDVLATLAEARREVETLEYAREFSEVRLRLLDRSLERMRDLVSDVRNGSYDKEQPARRGDGRRT